MSRPSPWRLVSPVLAASLLSLVIAPAPRALAGETSFSGLFFGDYYWIVSHNDKSIQDRTAFWIRRAYFTVDHPLDEGIETRFRLEMNDPGDFTTSSRLTPYLKEAWVKWALGDHALVAGLGPTPTWHRVEAVWGYRFLEKTPLDLQRLGTATDLGVGMNGAFGSGKRAYYRVMLSNGGGTSSEADKGKRIMGSLGQSLASGLVFEIYGESFAGSGSTNSYTVQGFVGRTAETMRWGVQYAKQIQEQPSGGDIDIDLVSVFAAWRARETMWLVGRVDHLFDPNPDAGDIAYLKLDPTAEQTLFIGGVDFVLRGKIHLVPNIEAVVYSEENGASPDEDIFARLTLYVPWP
jgi:hypothetical protein